MIPPPEHPTPPRSPRNPEGPTPQPDPHTTRPPKPPSTPPTRHAPRPCGEPGPECGGGRGCRMGGPGRRAATKEHPSQGAHRGTALVPRVLRHVCVSQGGRVVAGPFVVAVWREPSVWWLLVSSLACRVPRGWGPVGCVGALAGGSPPPSTLAGCSVAFKGGRPGPPRSRPSRPHLDPLGGFPVGSRGCEGRSCRLVRIPCGGWFLPPLWLCRRNPQCTPAPAPAPAPASAVPLSPLPVFDGACRPSFYLSLVPAPWAAPWVASTPCRPVVTSTPPPFPSGRHCPPSFCMCINPLSSPAPPYRGDPRVQSPRTTPCAPLSLLRGHR